MSHRGRFVRFADMSNEGNLVIFIDDDGDVIIELYGQDWANKFHRVHVEFCEVGDGGGHSPHTIEALRAVAKAMERDNQEHPRK